MEPRLQRRVQRYGWDLAAADYEALWQTQLAPARSAVIDGATLTRGDRVLDVACGTGLVALAAATAVGPAGEVLGIDLSGRMVDAAGRIARQRQVANARFERMDGEALALPDASFDAALCALGLMYMPDPQQAVAQMRRVLRPGGRMALAVWGERALCGWSSVFGIVDAEIASDVCPLFFRLGQRDTLAQICALAGLATIRQRRIAVTLEFADAETACNAAFVGGPVALAWSRFDDAARSRVRRRYLDAITLWRNGLAYRIPGEFVVVVATAPGA